MESKPLNLSVRTVPLNIMGEQAAARGYSGLLNYTRRTFESKLSLVLLIAGALLLAVSAQSEADENLFEPPCAKAKKCNMYVLCYTSHHTDVFALSRCS